MTDDQKYITASQLRRIFAGHDPAPQLGRAAMAKLAQWTGNPTPACIDDERDRLRELRYRQQEKRARRLNEPRPRRPREFTSKKPGSRRFERLRNLLTIMENSHV